MKDLEETIAQTVKSAIESQAKAKLIEALGGVDSVADAMIRTLCNRKVKVDYREVPLIDHVLQQATTEAMKSLVVEIFDEQRAEIKKMLAARIRKDSASIADEIVGRMAAEQYSFRLREVRE